MGKQIKGLLYFFITDIRHSLFIFWFILFSILVLSLASTYLLLDLNDGDGVMAFSLTVPMYVYCAILGFLTVKEAIPFSIKMGATRKNLFLALGIFFFMLSFAKAIAASIIQELVDFMTPLMGIEIFSFTHLAYFTGDTWYTRILIDGSVMFFFLSFMFILGLLFYKYGMAGGGSVLGVLVVGLLLAIAKGWIFDFFKEVFATFDILFYYQLLGVGLVIYCFAFLFLRNITVVKVK